ncbi:MAG: large conductance mechanosensitive channel protein MscL [Anaerolineae bacterium]|nr:large conductance mechanosensitive channel protein MscL [Anaerolineae bacterium]
MLKEFRDFALRGNVLDLAIGFIMGAAFTTIVNSLVNDIIMPPLGKLLGGVDFSNLFIDLSGEGYTSLAAAQAAGAATINYGLFINALINFIIVALAMFLLVKMANRALAMGKKPEAPADPTTKDCPYCATEIPIKATRCPHCTSELTGVS